MILPTGKLDSDLLKQIVFDKITSVMVDGEILSEGPGANQYQVWYYTGSIGSAAGRVTEDLKHTRDDAAAAYLTEKGWTQDPLSGIEDPKTADKEKITAFMVVFGSDVVLQAGHAAFIAYHTVVKAVPHEQDDLFNNSYAFNNAVNDFYIKYNENPDVKNSNPVSITLIDKDVEIQGDVWIDEDWDNLQEPGSDEKPISNRRPYSKYAIINLLGDNVEFKITDKRTNTTADEDEEHGNNTMNESIRHFTFTELSPAQALRTPLYGSDKKILKSALKGENPAIYELSAFIKPDALAEISRVFKLTGNIDEPLPAHQTLTYPYVGHYVSDNPDTLAMGDKNARDNNFMGSSGSYSTYPFFIRYSNSVDESKDIGFRMYRSVWRYASIDELLHCIAASAITSGLYMLIRFIYFLSCYFVSFCCGFNTASNSSNNNSK